MRIHSTERSLQKFASVHELKQFLLENYSEIRKYCLVLVLYENNHSLIMQTQLLYEHFPESPWVSHFMAYTLSNDNVFSIESILTLGMSAIDSGIANNN